MNKKSQFTEINWLFEYSISLGDVLFFTYSVGIENCAPSRTVELGQR